MWMVRNEVVEQCEGVHDHDCTRYLLPSLTKIYKFFHSNIKHVFGRFGPTCMHKLIYYLQMQLYITNF